MKRTALAAVSFLCATIQAAATWQRMSGFTARLAAAMPARSVSDETRVSAGGSNMRRRLRACLANALLVTVSVLLTYAIAEVVFFRVALPYLSLSTLPHIPDRAAFFLQGSKREYVPHDYIALVGAAAYPSQMR